MSREIPDKLAYSFSGKNVLVTGGGSGVGLALVGRLYKDGANVFVLERDPAAVAKLRTEFPDKKRMTAEECDVSDWKKTQALIESFGPMHHLVNCAAILGIKEFLDIEEDLVDNVMGINLKGYICTSQAVAKGMIKAGIKGTIVNVSSIAAHIVSRQTTVYNCTKSGVLMLTKCMAVNLGKYGIRTTSVSPTSINTPLLQEFMTKNPDAYESDMHFNRRQPLSGNKWMEPDDMVNSILFLLSPLSGVASGIDLLLDAGILSC